MRKRKFVHLVNILFGIFIVPFSVFQLYNIGDTSGSSLAIWIPVISIFLWIFFYILQAKFMTGMMITIALGVQILYHFYVQYLLR